MEEYLEQRVVTLSNGWGQGEKRAATTVQQKTTQERQLESRMREWEKKNILEVRQEL